MHGDKISVFSFKTRAFYVFEPIQRIRCFFMSDTGCSFVRLKIKDCNELSFWNAKVDARFKYRPRTDLIKMHMKIYSFICQSLNHSIYLYFFALIYVKDQEDHIFMKLFNTECLSKSDLLKYRSRLRGHDLSCRSFSQS